LELGTKAVQLTKKRQGWFALYMRRRRHRAHHRILHKNTKYGLVRGISSERFEMDAANLARLGAPESCPPEPRPPEPCPPESNGEAPSKGVGRHLPRSDAGT
jgi:hypothetical protein